MIIIIAASTWIGFDMSKRYQQRVLEIRQFILSLQMLENEMVYSQLPLQQLFNTISSKLDFPTQLFYQHLADDMTYSITDFSEIWDMQLNSYQRYSSMGQREIDIISQFGRTLGQHTAIQQQKHIVLTIKYLENELEEAIDNRKKYEKMSKTIGILIGIFIVLLLI